LFAEQGWIDPNAIREEVDMEATAGANQDLTYPLAPLQCEPGKAPPNVVVLLIDSMRHDELPEETAPYLSSLQGEPGWITARDHYSGGNSTKAGVFSLFYSLPVNYWDAFTAAQKPPVLMNQLKHQDYQFKVLSSATLLSPAFDRNIFSGLQDVELSAAAGGEKWQRDRSITQQWLQWHENNTQAGQPYFSFLFFDAVHGPSMPEDFPRIEPFWETVNHMALGPDFDAEPYFNRHRTAVRYVDTKVKQVIERLKASGELENTVVIVTSDHGDSFNEHGQNYWGHGSNYSHEQVKVPLMMHLPGQQGQTLQHPTHHFDVVPTVMQEALACETAPKNYALGKSLFDKSAREWMLSGSYMGYGILLPNMNIEVSPAGTYQIFDYQMRKLNDKSLKPSVGADVLEALSRFYQ